MLTYLHIENFALIDKLVLECASGMTVVTGETGAGKSILLDALELVLGKRADSHSVRPEALRCEVTAVFDITHNRQACDWLFAHDYHEHTQCFLRRVISTDGKSRALINDKPAPLQSLRELAEVLINIHGQHEHQRLLHKDTQRELLDEYAGHPELAQQVAGIYEQWRACRHALEKCEAQMGDRESKLEFLRYQLQEFSTLNFASGELQPLEQEHKLLSCADTRIAQLEKILILLDDAAVSKNLTQAQQLAQGFDPPLKELAALLDNALIHIAEALDEARRAQACCELDPARLQAVEERLKHIYDLARKHRLKPLELPALQIKLEDELLQLEKADESREMLQQKLLALEAEYKKTAEKLSAARQQAAENMSQQITAHMQTLGMPKGKFAVVLEPCADNLFSAHGLEKVIFMVSANPGLPLQPLAKIASGGELSRISLAIQLIAAQTRALPVLVFDEVDVGIGGGTAAIVGRMLRELARCAQVICITHLPQVAAFGQHHWQVSKSVDAAQKTISEVNVLNAEEKTREIARMLGGLAITKKTLAHAEELLSQAE